ncbi:MAG: hypothetical protein IT580_14565 [Verrucomicrobiales bacterium]|nr:hypothetical protein [Verrucomicrobiales bacterium]
MRTAVAAVACCAALAAASDIRDVDFQRFAYAWDARSGGVPSTWAWLPVPTSSIRLGGGRRVLPPGDEFSPSVSFDGATYGDLTGDGRADAAVRPLYRTGGTANWRYLYASPRLADHRGSWPCCGAGRAPTAGWWQWPSGTPA